LAFFKWLVFQHSIASQNTSFINLTERGYAIKLAILNALL